MKNIFYLISFLLLIISCENSKVADQQKVNTDTLIQINELALKANLYSEIDIPLSNPINQTAEIISSLSNTNLLPLGKGEIKQSFTPAIKELKQARKYPADYEKKLSALPKVTQALPFRTREVNPQNIKFLDIEQGLKNSLIYSVIEDVKGGIWFGSKMGISKYDGKFLTSYTENEGLVSNNVSAIYQDKLGSIWVGTRGNGISKFDGKYFYNYKSDSVLINNTILSIFEDSNGVMWFGTDLGAITLKDGKFELYSKEQGILSNVSCILEDSEKNIILTTYGQGFFKIKNNLIQNYTEKEGLSDNVILTAKRDDGGNIWFGGNSRGISIFDNKTFKNYSVSDGITSNSIMSISFDKNTNAWLGAFGSGINKMTTKDISFIGEQQGLNHKLIRSIICGKSGEIWIGTEGAGIAKYEGDIFTHYTVNEGLSNNTVWSGVETKPNEFWFATDGGGICRQKEGKFETIKLNPKTGQEYVTTACIKGADNTLWIGTLDGGLYNYKENSSINFRKENGLINNSVWSLLNDRKGNLWIGTSSGFSKFNGKNFTNFTTLNKVPISFIFDIYEDKKGNIWFATSGNGVIKYNGTDFFNYTTNQGLTNNVISCIYEDSFGFMWFGSQNGGVSRFDGKSFVTLSEANGLSNNAVLAMIEDNNKNMWFGTRGGLNKLNSKYLQLSNPELNGKTKLFNTYGVSEGFSGNNCLRNSVMKDSEGKIWWGTLKMLTCYNPAADKEDTLAPTMQITGLKLFFDDVNWANLEKGNTDSISSKHEGISFDSVSYWNAMPVNLTLPYNQNHVTINYIGINFRSQEKIMYEYIMEGFEDNWNPITNKTEAVYSNLPAGNFTFKVRAMNKDGVWSQPITYNFTVTPPWWKTWWFRTLAILTIVAAVWFYIKQRERVLRERQMELEKTVEERTHEVVEQKEIIEEKQKEILDSINYAKRIQRALLASKNLLDEHLIAADNKTNTAEDYFVYFQPKDIVSGDFYWASKLANGNFVVVTADSTGHGVPGAIMSMLNISCLNESVNGKELTNAADILNHTRSKVIANLANDGSAEGGKDGMDCSVICYDFKNLKMNYAAANNPVWVVRKSINESGETIKELIELKPDKMPCGKHDKDQTPFNSFEFELKKGDVVYALTDGFPDQFGGEKGKKYMYKQLKEFLTSNSDLPLLKQYKALNAEFNYWKQDKEQVDDVLIIGVKV